jgi:hypothetical protein
VVSRIDRLINIATLVACSAVLVAVYRMPKAPTRAQPQPYQRGDTIAALDQAPLSSAAQTVLLVLRDGCHYCKESVPFYRAS